MDFHKIPLTDDEFKLLCKRFSHEGFEFNYLEFVEILTQFEHNWYFTIFYKSLNMNSRSLFMILYVLQDFRVSDNGASILRLSQIGLSNWHLSFSNVHGIQ